MDISQHVGVSPPEMISSSQGDASSPNFGMRDTTQKIVVQTITTSIAFILRITIRVTLINYVSI
jgi:hypothetical protein